VQLGDVVKDEELDEVQCLQHMYDDALLRQPLHGIYPGLIDVYRLKQAVVNRPQYWIGFVRLIELSLAHGTRG